ncbi:MAG: hypothetical protein K6C36_07755 [Clostridia bacterium]|nr:hypothetical protein [Clostridia bacterium]
MAAFIDFFKRFFAWIKNLFSKDEPIEPVKPDDPDYPIVCYYGCPNSKKAEKLQLQRKPCR